MLMGGSHLSVAARRSVRGAGREAERDFSVTVNRRLQQFVIALLFLSFLPSFLQLLQLLEIYFIFTRRGF